MQARCPSFGFVGSPANTARISAQAFEILCFGRRSMLSKAITTRLPLDCRSSRVSRKVTSNSYSLGSSFTVTSTKTKYIDVHTAYRRAVVSLSNQFVLVRTALDKGFSCCLELQKNLNRIAIHVQQPCPNRRYYKAFESKLLLPPDKGHRVPDS